MTFKQGQDCQSLYESKVPEKGYNHAKFERLFQQCRKKKPKLRFCQIKKIMPITSLELKKYRYIHDLALVIINNHTKFQLIWITNTEQKSKPARHCCDLKIIWSNSLKVLQTGKTP